MDLAVCSGCLTAGSEVRLQSYTAIESALIAASNKSDEMMLCSKCFRCAELLEKFLENVRLAQALLASVATLTEAEALARLDKAKQQIKSIKDFNEDSSDIDKEAKGEKEIDSKAKHHEQSFVKEEQEIDIECPNNDAFYDKYTVVANDAKDKSHVSKVKHKKEKLKQEPEIGNDCSDSGAFSDNDFEPSIIRVKEDEFDPEVLGAIKREMELGEIKNLELKPAKRMLRKVKQKIRRDLGSTKQRKKTQSIKGDIQGIEAVILTPAELRAEMERARRDRRYLAAGYRCERCVKGFTFRETYERHMLTHVERAGREPCGLCGRCVLARDLRSHRAAHHRRYRCAECGLTRATRTTVAEHYAAEHARDTLHQCTLCPKTYLKRTLLMKHIAYQHSARERHPCLQCNKTFAAVECLREHVRAKHESAAAEAARHENACAHCERTFRSPSHLRAHAVKHSSARDHYCVECDRRFKSEAILKWHLRTASAHVDPAGLPLGCDYCEQRFMVKREVQRHIAKLHLNIKPHKCDQCEKAYASGWSLQQHRKVAHEGYKLPLRFPCTMCDKIFTRNAILQTHVRTHTGERPYRCPECPATFSQSGVLHTHNRLIHLKLRRDGTPKAGRCGALRA